MTIKIYGNSSDNNIGLKSVWIFPFLLDKDNGIREVAVTKKKDERRKVHPDCAKASNPYHECADYCMNRNGELLGVKKEPGLFFFGPSLFFILFLIWLFETILILILLLYLFFFYWSQENDGYLLMRNFDLPSGSLNEE